MARARCVGNAPCAQRLGGALAPRTGRLGRSESAQTAQNASLGLEVIGHEQIMGVGRASAAVQRLSFAGVCAVRMCAIMCEEWVRFIFYCATRNAVRIYNN